MAKPNSSLYLLNVLFWRFILEKYNDPKLVEHERLIQEDFKRLNYPIKNWVPKFIAPNNKPLIDVLVIGGGMNGLAAAFALRCQGVQNIRQVDEKEFGQAGPWLNFARMEYLRSPKHLTGPALNIPNLTFRAWWEAKNSKVGWEKLGFIKREEWAEYLKWFEKITNSKIEYNTKVTNIDFVKLKGTENHNLRPCYRVHIRNTKGASNSSIDPATNDPIYARYIVLANGREGLAQPRIPKIFKNIQSKNIFHSSEKINFSFLKNKRVFVIGVGASALDNAACAAEAGGSVTVIARAPKMPLLNKMKNTVYPGFAEGFHALKDHEKLAWITHIQNERIAPPKHTVERVEKLGIKLILGSEVCDLKELETEFELTISSLRNQRKTFADFIILGTGFVIDLGKVPELESFSSYILLWKDVLKSYKKRDGSVIEMLDFPYLGKKFEFKSTIVSKQNQLKNIRCFNHAAQLSLGNLANDIPHSNEGAHRLAKGIAEDLFQEDKTIHFENLKNYTELEITGSEWSQIPD